jgi:DNA modification methylase
MHLIAGGRRMGAIAQLQQEKTEVRCDGIPIPLGHFPVIVLGYDIDDITAKEAELDENLVREDLTWQDTVTAQKELHDLRLLQNPEQTLQETAEEIVEKKGLGESVKHRVNTISRATIIGAHLNDPEVAASKSERDAWKVVSRKLEREFEALLPPVESPHQIIVGEAIEIMRRNDSWKGKYQCIITDPPYGIDADKFGDAAALRHTYNDEDSLQFYFQLIDSASWITTDEAMLYMFCDIEYFTQIRQHAKKCGWEPRRTPLLWLKGHAGHLDSGFATGWRRTYEMIFVAWKPNVKMKELVSDTFNISTEHNKTHAAQKPAELYKTLLRQCCVRGHQVLDPCCGSGTIFDAATDLDLVATGIELDPEMAEIARSRMNKPRESTNGAGLELQTADADREQGIKVSELDEF